MSAALKFEIVTNLPTPFKDDYSVDEREFEAHVGNMLDAGVNLFLGSPGSGSGHFLSPEELRRTCEIAVAACRNRGKGRAYAMVPEVHTIEQTLEYARLLDSTGVDEVQFFQWMGGHDIKPTLSEQSAYWNTVLNETRRPVALSFHAIAGYVAPAQLVGQLCRQYTQVQTVYTYQADPGYMLELRDAIPPHIKLGGHTVRGAQDLTLGANILTGAEPNLIPRTCIALVDSFERGDMAGVMQAYQRIHRLSRVLKKWSGPFIRSLKMAMRVMELPGGKGPLRRPLEVPSHAELAELRAALEAIGVKQWEEGR